MRIKEFAKEAVAIIPTIHAELVKRQPPELMKGRVTFSQMVIMDILREKGECKMSDIANALHVTKSAVTGITDRLIKIGLLQRSRSRSDRRVVKIKLTPKGLGLSKKFYNFKVKVIREIFGNINPRERTQYLTILRKLQKNINTKREYVHYG